MFSKPMHQVSPTETSVLPEVDTIDEAFVRRAARYLRQHGLRAAQIEQSLADELAVPISRIHEALGQNKEAPLAA